MLLAAPVSHTDIQYMDFVEVLKMFHSICLLFILLVLGRVELPLCVVVAAS